MFEIETVGPCLVHKLEWEMGGGRSPLTPPPSGYAPGTSYVMDRMELCLFI